MDWIRANGLALYLNADPDLIEMRLRRSSHERPVLAHVEPERLRDVIDDLMAKRKQCYLQAHLTLHVDEEIEP
jgi:shikimate kinase